MRDMTIRRNYQVYLPRLKEGTGVSRKDTENLLLVVVLWFSPFFLCVLLVFYSTVGLSTVACWQGTSASLY